MEANLFVGALVRLLTQGKTSSLQFPGIDGRNGGRHNIFHSRLRGTLGCPSKTCAGHSARSAANIADPELSSALGFPCALSCGPSVSMSCFTRSTAASGVG